VLTFKGAMNVSVLMDVENEGTHVFVREPSILIGWRGRGGGGGWG